MADPADDAGDDDTPAEADPETVRLFLRARREMAEARRHSASLDAELADLKGKKKALADERAEWQAADMRWAAVCDGSAGPPQPELPGLDGDTEGDG